MGDMLDLMQSGDETAIAMAMERAGQEANLQDIRFSTQVSYYAQQMMKALGVERLEQRMMEAFRERYVTMFARGGFGASVPERLSVGPHCVDLEHYWRTADGNRSEGTVLVRYAERDGLIGRVQFLRP